MIELFNDDVSEDESEPLDRRTKNFFKFSMLVVRTKNEVHVDTTSLTYLFTYLLTHTLRHPCVNISTRSVCKFCHRNTRTELLTLTSCYMVIGFLLLDVTVSCDPMNVSKATRQLLRRLAFNLHNLGLFGIKLKPGVV